MKHEEKFNIKQVDVCEDDGDEKFMNSRANILKFNSFVAETSM